MDEIKVGEYIRTLFGEIYKYDEGVQYCVDKDNFYNLIVKHSKNIIDLIEVGDIVNGNKVRTMCYGKKEGVEHTINFELENGQVYLWKEKFGEETYDFQLKIETILTREMYEQNCYKVGKENE